MDATCKSFGRFFVFVYENLYSDECVERLAEGSTALVKGVSAMEIGSVRVGDSVRTLQGLTAYGYETQLAEGCAFAMRDREVGEVTVVDRDPKGLDIRVAVGGRTLWFISTDAGSLDTLEICD